MQENLPCEESIIREIAEVYAAQRYTQNRLISIDPRVEFEKYKSHVQTRVEEGVSILSSLYEESKKRGGPTIPFLELDESSFDKEKILQELSMGNGLSGCFNLDNQILENLYTLTIPLFDQSRWQDLSQTLFALTLLSPENPTFLHALGHAEYELGHYLEARALYITAYYMNPENRAPLEDAIDCCEKMGDTAAKEDCLKICE